MSDGIDMPHLFLNSEWRSVMSAISLAPEADETPRLAAADFLAAHGDTLRASYIRACCQKPLGIDETIADNAILPPDSPFVPVSGWVPHGDLLYFWERGFVARVHGPLDALRRELPQLMLREPLYQTPTGPLIVSVTDRAACRLEYSDGEERWTWGNDSPDAEETRIEVGGPMLPAELFDLLPWPPLFDSNWAAAVALSSALLSEAHERFSEFE